MIPRQSPSGPNISLLTSVAEYANGPSGAVSLDVDWSRGPVQSVLLTGNAVLNVFIGLKQHSPAALLRLIVQQDATGSRVPNLLGVLTASGTPLAFSTAAGATDIVDLFWRGSNMYGKIWGLNFQ